MDDRDPSGRSLGTGCSHGPWPLCRHAERILTINRGGKRRQWLCVDLPEVVYEQALSLQRRLAAAISQKILDRDVVLLLEHPPVFTLGRRGGLENLTVPGDFLEKSAIPVVQVERGGNITYHGPGQLVAYPIVDLRRAGLDVVAYVTGLEAVMMRIAADWGITARRRDLNRGVWVGGDKLGSVGITVRKGVSFHGFAINVDVCLDPFGWINPCGLKGVGVTSLAEQTGRPVSLAAARASARRHMAAVFHARLDAVGLAALKGMAGIED